VPQPVQGGGRNPPRLSSTAHPAPRTAARGYLPRSAFPQLARPISHTQITRSPPSPPSELVIYALEPSFSPLLDGPRCFASLDGQIARSSQLCDKIRAAPQRSLIYLWSDPDGPFDSAQTRALSSARRRDGAVASLFRELSREKKGSISRARARARGDFCRGRGLILESFVRPARAAVKSRETRGNIARPVYLSVTLFWYFVTRARPIRSVE